jgi:hypothetical protein
MKRRQRLVCRERRVETRAKATRPRLVLLETRWQARDAERWERKRERERERDFLPLVETGL